MLHKLADANQHARCVARGRREGPEGVARAQMIKWHRLRHHIPPCRSSNETTLLVSCQDLSASGLWSEEAMSIVSRLVATSISLFVRPGDTSRGDFQQDHLCAGRDGDRDAIWLTTLGGGIEPAYTAVFATAGADTKKALACCEASPAIRHIIPLPPAMIQAFLLLLLWRRFARRSRSSGGASSSYLRCMPGERLPNTPAASVLREIGSPSITPERGMFCALAALALLSHSLARSLALARSPLARSLALAQWRVTCGRVASQSYGLSDTRSIAPSSSLSRAYGPTNHRTNQTRLA